MYNSIKPRVSYKLSSSSKCIFFVVHMLLSTSLKIVKKKFLFACMKLLLILMQFGKDPVYRSMVHQAIHNVSIGDFSSMQLFPLHIPVVAWGF